ncbi:hypothetical protein AKJ39_02055 [candidate division MSBL1 archaeon SCGC-AAA259J03]|uniref:Flavin prenyltransferase UbiX n=1 Tax=candidate division MSBL1 archaeon SCGC-AAA259J03 TaxID=1698269 RepID=A0A656YWS3_9EURY|nr:hypothetical protein AKJ39_02055 [candidate division MSBL1 archaeon SCGC-AAA259J03]
MSSRKRVIIGMSGATGQIMGFRLLKKLKELDFEIHLVISETAEKIIEHELEQGLEEVKKVSDTIHDNTDLSSPISSGSFHTDGMIISPCSMKTLAAVANGYTNSLLSHSANVTLKEERKLILLPREKPLHEIHLKNLLRVSQAGALVLPPVPSFYNNPSSVMEIVDEIVSHAIDLLTSGVNNVERGEWQGF